MRSTPYVQYIPAWLACGAALVLATGCTYTGRTRDVEDTIYERTSVDLAQAPEAAASCVMRNARDAGFFASQTPLYGTMSMAVSIRTAATGDTLASLNLVPNGRASQGAVIMLRNGPRFDQAKLETILKGC